MSGEDSLIARYFAPISGRGGLGLLDDAALLAVPDGSELVLTKDMLVSGIHFFADDPPASIARKALRVNLSDLAAKGAEPVGFLLGLGLPQSLTGNADRLDHWLAAFSAALDVDSQFYGCPLVGGDTVSSPERLTLSITAFGQVPKGKMVRRTSAKTGDHIFVTGTIGDSALGLQARLNPAEKWVTGLVSTHKQHILERYLHPQPRNALALALRNHANAGMDVSDGLVGDLEKMMRASHIGANIMLDDVPLSDAARAALMAAPSLAEIAFTGGDDYEVLCTVSAAGASAFLETAKAVGVPLARIGVVTEKSASVDWSYQGREVSFKNGSYSHI